MQSWNDLVQSVAADDGLEVRDCGAWTEDKLFFWFQYLNLTTTAMADNPKWKGLAYVDLFAGPGICCVRDTGRRLPGSPIIAASTNKPFRKIILCELSKATAQACKERVQRCSTGNAAVVFEGDCNESITSVIDAIPDGALTLAFLDPPGLDIHFESVRRLSTQRPVDYLMLFADAIDLIRNVEQYVQVQDSKIDRMLGDQEWRRSWSQLTDHSAPRVRQFFLDEFQRRLQDKLSYRGFRTKQIGGARGPLYSLLYASKHERGVEFWDNITRRDRKGQSEWGF